MRKNSSNRNEVCRYVGALNNKDFEFPFLIGKVTTALKTKLLNSITMIVLSNVVQIDISHINKDNQSYDSKLQTPFAWSSALKRNLISLFCWLDILTSLLFIKLCFPFSKPENPTILIHFATLPFNYIRPPTQCRFYSEMLMGPLWHEIMVTIMLRKQYGSLHHIVYSSFSYLHEYVQCTQKV